MSTTDAGVPAAAVLRSGGDLKSKKVIRIAWTFDDGPTSLVTGQMERALKGIPATWYIMRNQIESGNRKKNLVELKRKQDLGGEIAIHSLHPTRSHVSWFPGKSHSSYEDVGSAVNDLKDFLALLQGEGIRVKFVRFPGGLYSELMAYLYKLGVDGQGQRDTIARNIIAGRPIPRVSKKLAEAEQVKKDFEFVKASLKELGLHEWGGSGRGEPEIGVQSWQAQSDPEEGKLDDTLTGEKGKFTTMVPRVAEGGGPGSLVILAHDTRTPHEKIAPGATALRVAKTALDIAAMEKQALERGVRIDYYRMRDLFVELRGEEP
ncbi:polysaccharide deacetylase family protein [Streptomyces sp. NPDC001530]|uniref:polysaccharide deacetylase family protein n=1 Tax=Streptomyces sp. NPDC001530 TaxID=3364582 RepID=UPI0036935442